MKTCGYCGGQNSDEAANCSGCGYELPASAGQTPATPVQKRTTAGFWIRALARIIDDALGLLVGLAAGFIALAILLILNAVGVIEPGWQQRIQGFSLAFLGCCFMGEILYHFFCEGIHGATFGKLCCGIRVVREDGRPNNFKGALIRTLAFYFDSLIFGLVAYSSMDKSPLNQRYGDVWGKTAVLKDSEVGPESLRSPVYFVLGFFIGLACWIGSLTLGLVLKAW